MATVDSLITDARNYAISVLAGANQAIGAAMASANSLGQMGGGPLIPTVNISAPGPGDLGAVPEFKGSGFVDPGFSGAAPVLTPALPLDISGDPGPVPSVVGFSDPGTQPYGDPGDPGLIDSPPDFNLGDFSVPPSPDLLGEIRGIPRPSISPIRIPAAPQYMAPEFLGTSPSLPDAAPTGLDSTLQTTYLAISPVMRDAVRNELDAFIDREFPEFRTGLAAVEGRLSKYLDGGTALTDEVQDAIYNRASSKSDAEYRRNYATVVGNAARLGHTIPGPVLTAQLQQADKDRRDAGTAVARDLMVKVAELEQQNLQFAVTQSANLRGMMVNAGLNYYGGLVTINGQAVQYAQSVVESIVKVYDTLARQKEIEARIYESEGNIYQAKVRGALSVLEAYQTQVKALEAQANVEAAAVNAYRAQIDAVQAEASVYKAQVEGVIARAQIARNQTDIYQARVQAYAAQVNAWTAQWSGYKAAVDGEIAKVNASAEQVRGFQAQAAAYNSVINARVAQIEGINKTNDGLLRSYTTALEAYRTQVNALAEVDRAKVQSFDTTIKAFTAKANAIGERSRAEIASYEASLRAVVASAEMQFRMLHEKHDLDIHRVEALARLSESAAANYRGVAQSALSGMNTLVGNIKNE